MKKIIFVLISLFIFSPFVKAGDLTIHLFYSDSCPHCKSEKEFLSTLDDVEIKYYEVSEESSLFNKVRSEFKIKEPYVPVTIIGSDYKIGYSEDIKKTILEMIDSYSKTNYCDAVNLIIENKNISDCLKINSNIYKANNYKIISIFGFDFKFNVKNVSLPIISILIGFIDGFNPCAMWILIFLISMLFNMKDRKKMWILGITFLMSSSFVYLVFMLGILNIANYIGNYFKYIIALVALVGGTVNLVSFIRSFKKNVGCEVTNKNQRKKIIDRVKSIVYGKNFIISLIGIIILAISVNIVELACSAGLPTMFVEILSLNNLSTIEYMIYMLLYILMFMFDDILIFVIAMTTLKITGISNKYTKYSHLVGGIIMILIGLLMIFKTDWLMFNF